MPMDQGSLPFGPVKNSGLFSNHWLTNRLALEPEWSELRDSALEALQEIAELWKTQKNRVAKYRDEQGLEAGFIMPVLYALGWKLKYQTLLEDRKPDYALFLDDQALQAAIDAGRNAPEFWNHPAALADAKAWHVALDRPSHVGSRREYPPEQIEWYLNRSRLDFAILTNGQSWRLIPREHGPQQRRFQTYLEFDLLAFLNDWLGAPDLTEKAHLQEDFLHFFIFFGPTAFRRIDDRTPLIRRAIDGSSEYRLGVGEGLKERTFEALRLCIEGFLKHASNRLHPVADLDDTRDQSFIFLYRLLFIMFAEDRQLLPYKRNRLYTNNRSLGRYRDEISGRLSRILDSREEDYSKQATTLWQDLRDLFDLVDSGHKNYGVPAYNGGLFNNDQHPFLAEKQLPDWYLARVIDQLGRATDPLLHADDLFRVDYHDLAIQHLGSIYEGLLELHPRWANERMIVVAKKASNRVVEKYIRASEPVPEGFAPTGMEYDPKSVFLETNKGERRETGSYYTPDHIVNYIVENTLGALCKQVSDRLQTEIDQTRASGSKDDVERLERDFDRRILELRILDPSMGSGHFLLRACQHVAEEIATNPHSSVPDVAPESAGEATMSHWKRQVVEKCLFGVDMNGLAVELAKLALWLETVAADQPLSFLDHHLRHGNSLVGARVSRMGTLPYEVAELDTVQFINSVKESLPNLLGILEQIRQQPSDTMAQVKTKDQQFKRFQKAREPFLQLADLWCSKYAEGNDSTLTGEQYAAALEVVGNPHKFKKLAAERWFTDALERARRPDMRCFCWELEFPEAFYAGQERHPIPGFDAIIGNPPYDVLSELENETNLTAFRAVIDDEPTYQPSKGGKNNLYKLFVCKAIDLLAQGGYFGFITPMAILGDDSAADLRRAMLNAGSFRAIEAFPQKDDPKRRIFPEAKLSTAVFIVTKDKCPENDLRPFRARVHPGRLLEDDSPNLSLTTAAIPLYDPANFTIVSCSQLDWDLTVRLMQGGRMGRLGNFCTSYQGEVNETTDKRYLSEIESVGPLILRGANLCLYAVRKASQGTPLRLITQEYLDGKSTSAKTEHTRQERAGFQRSSPQNNFRRIVAAIIGAGNFCFDTVSYVPKSASKLPLELIVGMLNSKLLDWYFRLGSTNSKVNEYQFTNLPCPIFANGNGGNGTSTRSNVQKAMNAGDTAKALEMLKPRCAEPPFSLMIRDVIIEAVKQISAIEKARGEIARAARSALHPSAQPYQDLIDQLLYRMAGLTDAEIAGLEERYAKML